MPVLYKIEDSDTDKIFKDKLRKILDNLSQQIGNPDASIQSVVSSTTSSGGGSAGLVNHAFTHQNGGQDEIKLDDLGIPDDNTDLDVSIAAHGLCPKAPNDPSMLLCGDGSWFLDVGLTPVSVPDAPDSDGIPNQWAYDSNYLYLCIATNSWKRIQYSTWLSPGVGNIGQPMGLLLAITYT